MLLMHALIILGKLAVRHYFRIRGSTGAGNIPRLIILLKKPRPSTIINRYCSAPSFTPQFSRRTPRVFPTINNLLPSMSSIYRHKLMEAALGLQMANTCCLMAAIEGFPEYR
jgi:hypothetical protein